MKLEAGPAELQEILGSAIRSRALEPILGLGLPAAELVFRPGVLQLQLPLLSLWQKRRGRGESNWSFVRRFSRLHRLPHLNISPIITIMGK